MRRVLVPALAAAVGLTAIGLARGAVIVGTPGPDRLIGTSRADELYGLGGNDRLTGRGATDLIDGGPGRDRLSGGPGPDRIAANDRQVDTVLCGSARDLVVADRVDRVSTDCETVSRQLSRDTGTDFEAQHETQVEPHSFAYGRTMVTVFQSGRFENGGAERIGFATSRDGGRTWRPGRLPGSFERVSDPVVVYDSVHRWWIATSLASEEAVALNRSRDGVSWRAPLLVSSNGQEYDKEWIACDNWPRSTFRGRCYLSYMNFANNMIEMRRSTDGGATWSEPFSVDAQRAPAGVNGVQIAVRPNGHVVLVFSVWGSPFHNENEIGAVRSTDGGVSFGADPCHSARRDGTAVAARAAVHIGGRRRGRDDLRHVARMRVLRGVSGRHRPHALARRRDLELPSLGPGRPRRRLAVLLPARARRRPGDVGHAGAVGASVSLDGTVENVRPRVWLLPGRREADDVDERRRHVDASEAAERLPNAPRVDGRHVARPNARRLRLGLVDGRPDDPGVVARVSAQRRSFPPVDLRDSAPGLDDPGVASMDERLQVALATL
jgi:RTX calcium-binding nonapeptide repeat (4 copies)